MLAQTFSFVTFNKVCTSQVSAFTLLHRYYRVLTNEVFSLVHGLSPILPSRLFSSEEAILGHYSLNPMGLRAGQ